MYIHIKIVFMLDHVVLDHEPIATIPLGATWWTWSPGPGLVRRRRPWSSWGITCPGSVRNLKRKP